MLEGKVRMIDGDTLRIGNERVRLHGIDAPERDQPCFDAEGQGWACGDWVTAQARAAFEGRAALCEKLHRDRYGRTVARCRVAGTDMGRHLVREGLAYAYRAYSSDYVADERAAASARSGIHAFRTETPARYRLGRRPPTVSNAQTCRIKGNISGSGRIYHLPGQAFYDKTSISPKRGERWFCSEAQARASGWRRARR